MLSELPPTEAFRAITTWRPAAPAAPVK